MSRRRMATLVTAGVVLMAALHGPDASAAPERVLYVGDSLGVGTTPGLARELGSAAAVQGDSRVGRPSPEGVQVLQQLFSRADGVVVFDLGTNDDPANPGLLAGDLADARRVAGDACMVVATLNRPPLNGFSVDGLNRAVEQFAARAQNVQLVDWHAYAQSDPNLLGPDRVHPTPQGYAIRAQLFAQAVSACAGGASAVPPAATRPRRASRPSRPAVRRHRRRPPIRVPGIESSGISFSVPLRVAGGSAQLLLPNTKPPYPAVVLTGAASEEADQLAHEGVAALTYSPRGAPNLAAAVAVLRTRKEIERGRIALWGAGDAAAAIARAAGSDGGIVAVVVVDPSVLPALEVRDWRIRRALGAPAPAVTKWLRLRARNGQPVTDPAIPWIRVSQAVYATWTRDGHAEPAHASALALQQALSARPPSARDWTFARAADQPAALTTAAQWLVANLKSRPVPVVDEQLPSPDEPAAARVTGASALYSVPLQLAWLIMPALLLLVALARMRAVPATTTAAGAALASLAAIAGGVAAALGSDGRGIASVAGLPWPFALAFVLAAISAAATVVVIRRGAFVPAAACVLWIALALFWLV